MAVPSNPTIDSLITEALSKAGYKDPSTSFKNRVKAEWVEEIKNDIWTRLKDLKHLQMTSYGVLVPGQSRYSNPADFSANLQLSLLEGDNSGLAQGGAVGYVDLAADTELTEANVIGREILITTGSGQASFSQAVSFNSTTKRATVIPNFQSAPAAGSGYTIINRKPQDLTERPIWDFSRYARVGTGRPTIFFPVGDEDFGEFVLDVAPDKAYGIRIRYYASIMKLDSEGTLMSTMLLHNRNLWLKGLEWRALKDNKHADAPQARGEYFAQLNTLVFSSSYGGSLNMGQQRVMDY